MITFHVRCRLREGQSDEAERLISNLVATVEREGTDAVFYSFFRSTRDPQEIVLVESYTSNEAFMSHNGRVGHGGGSFPLKNPLLLSSWLDRKSVV